MGHDVRSWGEGGEEGVEVVSGDEGVDEGEGFGGFGAVLLELEVVEVEVEDIPLA